MIEEQRVLERLIEMFQMGDIRYKGTVSVRSR